MDLSELPPLPEFTPGQARALTPADWDLGLSGGLELICRFVALLANAAEARQEGDDADALLDRLLEPDPVRDAHEAALDRVQAELERLGAAL